MARAAICQKVELTNNVAISDECKLAESMISSDDDIIAKPAIEPVIAKPVIADRKSVV